MRCRICGKRSHHPVCKDCSSDAESKLIRNIEILNKQLRLNRIEIAKRTFRLPSVSYNFWISLVFFILYLVFLAIISSLKRVELQMLAVIPVAIFPITAVYFWGEIPEKNIKNGTTLINLKQKNYQMMRYRKRFFNMLKKIETNWSEDDRLSIIFKGL